MNSKPPSFCGFPLNNLAVKPSLVLSVVSITIFACGNTAILNDPTQDGDCLDNPVDCVAVEICDLKEQDVFFMDPANLNGDIITVRISYSGGCKDHDFQACWEGSFMESYPVQARIKLIHDAHGDACEALISQVVAIDLTPMKESYQAAYQESGTIIIHLDDQTIVYSL